MGLNTVAVLYNDMTDDIAKQMPRLAMAMRDWSPVSAPTYFGVGRVVSRDHADGYQVVVIGGNTGWGPHELNRAPKGAAEALCRAIDGLGWKKVRGKWRAPEDRP